MSAGAMRFPSRGRWLLWLIVLLVLGPFLVIFPAALWLGWTMNPVQNFYLGTYAACTTLSGTKRALFNRTRADINAGEVGGQMVRGGITKPISSRNGKHELKATAGAPLRAVASSHSSSDPRRAMAEATAE